MLKEMNKKMHIVLEPKEKIEIISKEKYDQTMIVEVIEDGVIVFRQKKIKKNFK